MKIRRLPPGDQIEVLSGGKIIVRSGGTLQVDAGATMSVGDALQAPSDIALADGHILVGVGGGKAADVAMSGDASIVDTGAVTVTGLNGAATALTGTEANLLHSVVAGIVSVSKALVVDAAGALSGLLIKLGAAITGQSPPVAGFAPDLTVNNSSALQNTWASLNSLLFPANAMSANGKGIQFTFMGTTAPNANAKDFRLLFGALSTVLATGVVGSGVAFYCTGAIYRTGVGAQILVAEITIGNAAPFPVCAALAQDETTALTLALQSQNTAAAALSAVGKGAIAWFSN